MKLHKYDNYARINFKYSKLALASFAWQKFRPSGNAKISAYVWLKNWFGNYKITYKLLAIIIGLWMFH